MRFVQIVVDEADRDAVLSVIREHGFGYVEADGTGDTAGETIITFVTPADAVEHVLDDLVETGFDRTRFTVSIEAEFASYEDIDGVQEHWANTPNRLAPAALRSKSKDLRRNTRSYLWMMILSAVVAASGLLLSSPAVVVGSMVIAPIVSPALTASVGLVRNDRDMLVDSIHMQGMGLAVAIVTAALFGLVVGRLDVVSAAIAVEQLELVVGRISPTILAITVGLAAGAAGAYGLATKGSATIVGVMIAAALIPTAAAVGIGAAWGNPVVALGALLLLVLSVIAVNVGGAAMLFYLGYRPDDVDTSLFALGDTRETLVVGATALVVLGTAIAGGAAFYQQSGFERTVNGAITDVVEQREYEGLGVRSVSIEYVAPLTSDRTDVTVTLVRTVDRDFPAVPDVLDRTITARTDRTVTVRVRYVDYDSSAATSTRTPASRSHPALWRRQVTGRARVP